MLDGSNGLHARAVFICMSCSAGVNATTDEDGNGNGAGDGLATGVGGGRGGRDGGVVVGLRKLPTGWKRGVGIQPDIPVVVDHPTQQYTIQ